MKVSEVALGGWLTQGRTISDETTSDIVHRAFDLGIIFFDTADIYNIGEAEKSLAVAIKDLRRQDLVIATKCFWPMTDNPNDQGLSRKHIFESLHGSLERLQTDYVDLFQFHRADPETPIEESVRAIGDLIQQGKVLYWGVSEWTAEQISQAWHIAKEINIPAPVSNQPSCSMINRYIEKSVLPTSIQQGILTGKYKPGSSAPSGSRGADETSNRFMQGHLEDDELLTRVQKLGDLAEANGARLSQFALAWILKKEGISSVIVGATKTSQIEENAAASGLEFSDEVWAEAEEILGIE
jgi:aryl-alcohol dehydrogenase-like predicted oxidoreductase